MTDIQTLDLNFLGIPGSIAVYLIPHDHGAVLVETGPGSTIPALESALKDRGYRPTDITDVLLTHIHLDHGGAAGWMARQGARIHVHPKGAPHLVSPEKLLASAARIYGDQMDYLWGEFLPVPPESIHVPLGGDVVEVEDLQFTAIDTPGHAGHHYAYLFQGTCFTGDVGGVRLGGDRFLRLPTPPPEFEPPLWRESLHKLQATPMERIAPTHFGIYHDPDWHLKAALDELDHTIAWMEAVMPSNPLPEMQRQEFSLWAQDRFRRDGIDEALIDAQNAVNPEYMSADGIARYWKKVRASQP